MSASLHTHIAQAKEQYDRDGYAIFRNVLDMNLIAEARRHITWLMEQNPHLRPEQFHHPLMRNDPFWVRLVSDERLLDIADLFIGPNIALFSSHYISKPPRDGQAVLWHQDGSYWPLEPMNVVTLWLAVDDSTAENGCMRVIPGTQHFELQPMQENKNVANVLESQIDPAFVDEQAAVNIELRAGDVSVHHPNVIHGSNANTSERRRCGLTIRYIPTSTRVTNADFFENLFLMRGTPVSGVNEYRPFPRYAPDKHMEFAGCQSWS
ncbi:MAG TPA: phytanoyl-CoA dioxygenase family protein [Pirellulaceae bacterium]|nr:phytanoyl-CoA dioxygenase family protein [Pirellulaceae bacterium]HMO90929.1 phytanoyl-CoA dioxygenase family protein [Pirellulaceae bacterium]HMP69828.1 phytanoyl-CoA dioxygenase family protein [Pirellulaceae bacterium]